MFNLQPQVRVESSSVMRICWNHTRRRRNVWVAFEWTAVWATTKKVLPATQPVSRRSCDNVYIVKRVYYMLVVFGVPDQDFLRKGVYSTGKMGHPSSILVAVPGRPRTNNRSTCGSRIAPASSFVVQSHPHQETIAVRPPLALPTVETLLKTHLLAVLPEM